MATLHAGPPKTPAHESLAPLGFDPPPRSTVPDIHPDDLSNIAAGIGGVALLRWAILATRWIITWLTGQVDSAEARANTELADARAYADHRIADVEAWADKRIAAIEHDNQVLAAEARQRADDYDSCRLRLAAVEAQLAALGRTNGHNPGT